MAQGQRKVVVTGLGIVSPVGSTVKSAWENITNGFSGIKRIEAFDASNFSVQISGPVLDFNVDDFIDSKEQKKMDKFIHYGLAAGIMAIEDSGIEINENNSPKEIIKLGDEAFAKGYYERAGDYYSEINKYFPYSVEDELGLSKAVNAYFRAGKFEDSRLAATTRKDQRSTGQRQQPR